MIIGGDWTKFCAVRAIPREIGSPRIPSRLRSITSSKRASCQRHLHTNRPTCRLRFMDVSISWRRVEFVGGEAAARAITKRPLQNSDSAFPSSQRIRHGMRRCSLCAKCFLSLKPNSCVTTRTPPLPTGIMKPWGHGDVIGVVAMSASSQAPITWLLVTHFEPLKRINPQTAKS